MSRKATFADFDAIFSLYFHERTNPFLLYEMMDKVSFIPIFKELLEKDILYVFEQSGRVVGMFKLIPLTYRCSHIAYLGGVAIDPNMGGNGLGTLMMLDVLQTSKQMGIKRIELSVYDKNERAIRLYENIGFVREGLMRQYGYLKSENRYIDEILMSYLF
jgi:L-phenylalanine/L-methionine N-acetyltransferase